jgi:hypothetical protein
MYLSAGNLQTRAQSRNNFGVAAFETFVELLARSDEKKEMTGKDNGGKSRLRWMSVDSS